MKPIALISACSILLSTAFAADPPPEVAAARARYRAAVAAAIKPVRDRYAAELQQLKSRAVTTKNLDLANALDQELQSLSSEITAEAASAKPLTESLRRTIWYAQEKDATWERIEFTSEMKMIRIPKKGNPVRNTFPCEAGKDAESLTVKWDDGIVSTLPFSQNREEFRHAEATYKRTKPR
jgi:hypothetical protein